MKVAAYLDQQLDYEESKHTFWTDSQIVLAFPRNESKRFYVANRIQAIKEHSSSKLWNDNSSKDNPANLASPCVMAEEILWWEGPSFLQSYNPPENKIDTPIPGTDPEVYKKSTIHAITVDSTASMESRFENCSSWHRLRRAVALCLRYKRILMKPNCLLEDKGKDCCNCHESINTEELEQAEREIHLIVRHESNCRNCFSK